MKILILSVFFLVFSCANTQNFTLYNPFPEKDVVLSPKNNECASSSEIKVWYGLYGSYLISTLNIKEVFPASDYSYRIEYISTTGDKIISILTGLFFSISRHTMKIDTCGTLKKHTQLKFEQEEKNNQEEEGKLSKLEKEVAFLKGKLNGIESAFPMISSLSATGNRENTKSNREDLTNETMSYRDSNPNESETSIVIREKDFIQTKEIPSIHSKDQLHSYFLFKINSYTLNFTERKKIEKLRSILKNQKNKVLVVGYSDKFGKFEPNLNLSWKRALEVKRILVKFGVEESRIQLSAGGEIGDAKAAEVSRRVDLFVLGGNQ